MELFSKKSSFKKGMQMLNYSLFTDTIAKYAQETGATTPEGEPLDPNTLQVGQQIYDQDGKAHTVIQNESGNVTTMPVDQAGQQIPQGVKTVNPNDITNYSQQPPQQNVQAKRAQEELGIDWEELESMALEVATFAQAQKDKAFFAALDRLNTAALSYIQMPTDMNSRDLTAQSSMKECPYCDGLGEIAGNSPSKFDTEPTQPCPVCKGDGEVPSSREVDLSLDPREVKERDDDHWGREDDFLGRYYSRKAQMAPNYLRGIEIALLEAFSEAVDDIETDSYKQGPGYFETAAQGLLDSVNNELIVTNIHNLEGILQDKAATMAMMNEEEEF